MPAQRNGHGTWSLWSSVGREPSLAVRQLIESTVKPDSAHLVHLVPFETDPGEHGEQVDISTLGSVPPGHGVHDPSVPAEPGLHAMQDQELGDGTFPLTQRSQCVPRGYI